MMTVLTPNPSLDRTIRVETAVLGEAQKVEFVAETAGGKGLNVARVLRSLGAAARVVAPLGGSNGRRVAQLAADNGIVAEWHWLAQRQTRICTLLIESGAGRTTPLNEAGPLLTERDWQALVQRPACEDSQLLLICGSLPPGVAADAPAQVIRRRRARGLASWIDTSGAPLRAALSAAPTLMKVNQHELAAALQLADDDLPGLTAALPQLAVNGLQTLIVTRGAAGAIAYSQQRSWRVSAPQVQLASSVGCGDAFLAGLAAAATQGLAFPEQLRWAAASAAAEAISPLPGCVDAAAAGALRARVVVDEL